MGPFLILGTIKNTHEIELHNSFFSYRAHAMTVTKILGLQSGVQFSGVQDKSEADPRDSLVNSFFTGKFKNGPFNKPFKVTKENIRAKLGYDPDNLHYQAIEDALYEGAPFVWVMRVQSGCQPGTIIIDPGNFNYVMGKDLVLYAKITVDGVVTTDRIVLPASDASYAIGSEIGFTDSQLILNKIFFYSGIDLYRQSGLDVDSCFEGKSCINRNNNDVGFEINSNSNPLPGGLFYLEGLDASLADTIDQQRSYEKHNILLELLPAPTLQLNEQDVVMALWGSKGVSAHSCTMRFYIAS